MAEENTNQESREETGTEILESVAKRRKMDEVKAVVRPESKTEKKKLRNFTFLMTQALKKELVEFPWPVQGQQFKLDMTVSRSTFVQLVETVVSVFRKTGTAAWESLPASEKAKHYEPNFSRLVAFCGSSDEESPATGTGRSSVLKRLMMLMEKIEQHYESTNTIESWIVKTENIVDDKKKGFPVFDEMIFSALRRYRFYVQMKDEQTVLMHWKDMLILLTYIENEQQKAWEALPDHVRDITIRPDWIGVKIQLACGEKLLPKIQERERELFSHWCLYQGPIIAALVSVPFVKLAR